MAFNINLVNEKLKNSESHKSHIISQVSHRDFEAKNINCEKVRNNNSNSYIVETLPNSFLGHSFFIEEEAELLPKVQAKPPPQKLLQDQEQKQEHVIFDIRNVAPRDLIRFSYESADDFLSRCYNHDPRFSGTDKTQYPVLDDGDWVYPRFKALASEEEIQQCKKRPVDIQAEILSSVKDAPIIKEVYKAPCLKCGTDNQIDWFRYPGERLLKLGCCVCKTQIDIFTSYEVIA